MDKTKIGKKPAVEPQKVDSWDIERLDWDVREQEDVMEDGA